MVALGDTGKAKPTIQEIHRRSGVSVNNLYNIMNKGHRPGLMTVIALANGLGIDEDELRRAAGHPVRPRSETPETVIFSKRIRAMLTEIDGLNSNEIEHLGYIFEQAEPYIQQLKEQDPIERQNVYKAWVAAKRASGELPAPGSVT